MRRPARAITQARLARIETRLRPEPETPDFSRLASCTLRWLRDIGERLRDGQKITPDEGTMLESVAQIINNERDPGPEDCFRKTVEATHRYSQFPCTNCPRAMSSR